jgi:septum formation protein
MTNLILASTSPYRRSLLERLKLPFECQAPDADETPLATEAPADLVYRLALAKAKSVSRANHAATVIGSDQAASLDGKILGKPGNHSAATLQLRACSGREVNFYTGLAVVGENRGFQQVHVEPFTVVFRVLSDAMIDNYLHLEQPYDCAGSFKCEGLGIALFSRLRGDDPTALEGLPLISLVSILDAAGISSLK